MTTNSHDELLERARRTIRELRDRLNMAEARSHVEPIAVIGMGIQLPGSGSDLEKFWQMIRDGEDAIRPVPSDRWDGDAFYAAEAGTPGRINTRHAAFLDDVRRFDAGFFDIAPREAIRMDPQQRVFLETAWHALEHAGLPKSRVSGTDTGVFVGVHSHSVDYREMQFRDLASLDAYSGTGTAHDMISGRIAYWLDLHGPAVVVDTACSSSLTAIHYACRSLRAGDCTLALAGGVNLMLTPASTVSAAQLELLAPDGRSKTFDARADGMGRGEGCGVVVLKKLDAALRDGDRILAILRGSAINQDGRTNGLTAPNGLSQQRVLRKALEDAQIAPSEVGYVEAHGTGTALGDPIEVEALAEVLGNGTNRVAPCHLGSIKANIGHLEGAAGVVGLIKTVLVLRNRWRPPVAHLGALNPHFSLGGTGLEIHHDGSAWSGTGRRLAGVSSFGWSGTNVHVVLEEAAELGISSNVADIWPFAVSARSEEALGVLAMACADLLDHSQAEGFFDLCYTSIIRRTPHPYRIAVQGKNAREVAAQLRKRAAILGTNFSSQSDAGPAVKDEASDLHGLILAWETGLDIDWQKVFAATGRVVDLPRYPFEGRSHWLENFEPFAPAAMHDQIPHDWLYKTDWINKPLGALASNHVVQKSVWLLLCPEFLEGAQFALQISRAVQELGDRVILARRGSVFSFDGQNEATLGTSFAASLGELFELIAQQRIKVQKVLYIAGDQEVVRLVSEALEIAQAMVKIPQPVKLWYVTQRAESVQMSSPSIYPAQNVIRGLSRVFGMEYPERSGGVIDIDVMDSESVKVLCAEVIQESDEDRIAIRQGKRWAARLQRNKLDESLEPIKLRPDRCYLVTGAFGRLGMELASWLVEKGARHLALVGRRSPLELNNPELTERLSAWREQGVSVLAEACDVSNESQVRALIAKIQESGVTLAGLIHAAAGFRLRPIPELQQQDIPFVFDAKLKGGQNLDICTREISLNFFVLFGSAAGTLGPKNGALYAASNSGLNAIVAGRKALGLPVLCVEWGLWKTGEEEQRESLVGRSVFFEPMGSAKALKILDTLIVSGSSSSIVAHIDWNVLAPALEMRGRQSLISDMVTQREAVNEEENTEKIQWLEGLKNLSEEARRDRLTDFVNNETRKIFKMKEEDVLDENRGLFQVGMDSLMSIRLKRRLEVGMGMKLPGTLTLTYPTITAIAGYLDEKLFPRNLPQMLATESSMSQVAIQDQKNVAPVSELNDLETDMAIAAELAVIQKKMGVLR